MPIYTYRCKNCGIQFDEQQKFSDPPLTRCPECSKKTLTKVFQPVGIVFKGSGFYATDHRSPSGAGRSSSKSSEGGEKSSSESSERTSSSSNNKSGDTPSSVNGSSGAKD
jgi:putative FmdB family regulatory protein